MADRRRLLPDIALLSAWDPGLCQRMRLPEADDHGFMGHCQRGRLSGTRPRSIASSGMPTGNYET